MLVSFPITFESTGKSPEHTKSHRIMCKVWGKRGEFFQTLSEGDEIVGKDGSEERWKSKDDEWQSMWVISPNDVQVVRKQPVE